MAHARKALSAAVATVLALTAGAALTAVPAQAAVSPSVSAGVEAGQEVPLSFPAESEIVSAGKTGFLTQGEKLLWTRYADGSTVELPGKPVGNSRSDVVAVTTARNVFKLYDMAAGGEPVTVDLSADSSTYTPAAVNGSTLALWYLGELRLVRKEGDAVSQTTVDRQYRATRAVVYMADGELGVSSVQPGETHGIEQMDIVDTATGKVTQSFAAPSSLERVAATDKTLAWFEAGTLVVRDRATGATTRKQLVTTTEQMRVDLLGDWALTGQRRGLDEAVSPETAPLVARSLKDGGATVLPVLTHRASSVVAPDGALLVRGGTEEHGEGLYRIAPDADGVPAAALVAASGDETGIGVPQYTGADTLTMFGNIRNVGLSWKLNRTNVNARITLRHNATGQEKKFTYSGGYVHRTGLYIGWDGLFDSSAAPSGTYTWEVEATSRNGIGEPVHGTGTFTLAYNPELHDYTSNGSPDVLARDSAGRLWRDDTYYRGGIFYPAGRSLVGSGWQAYDRIEAAGNLGGSKAPDLVTRDKDGVLWLHEGKGDGTFAPRRKVGGGWGIYNKIAGGSDLTGDGKPDLLATDKAGDLWLLPGTGNLNAPFSARKKIGWGYGIYNQLVATGNVAGATPGDLVARDAAGVLWLYLGNGDGTLTKRIRVGSGWNQYTHLVPVGDANRWARQDLLAIGPNGSYLYESQGAWDAPFLPRSTTSLYAGETGKFNEFS
ncbi:FG-GAP repeat domain-containing protein [Streptomyces sp. NPDC021012]|uniref:FG-GAP repeat domain-containing protein n=1 Tax=Streptomyces sp. NPDC021012 TaxID=3365107 RepID=UPI003799F451